jgi:hypothetical protein
LVSKWPCKMRVPSPSHTSLPALLKGRVLHCRLLGKLLDNTRISPSFQTLHDLNNVVTEVVTFRADEIPAAAKGFPTVCSGCRHCKSVGGLRQASYTIDLASRASGPKGFLRTLSLSEPCISTGGHGRKSFDYPVTILMAIPL